MLPNIDAFRTTKKETCDCPVCSGLVCNERPRYFAGQLLTEAELNSEQAYLLAKNRLHNRYLHGYGIICGLQVSCHDCDGWVTVHPGYALDACGNDIVVCQAQDFDLIKAIRACREEKDRQCDPWREPVRSRCDDVEEEWCITIRYKEKEGKPTTALVSCSPSTCGCEGKHPAGKKCGCGNKSHAAPRPVSVGACEPSRIIEGFELGVVPAPRTPPSNDERTPMSTLVEILGRLGITIDLSSQAACLEQFIALAQRGETISNLLNQNPLASAAVIYRELCRLRDDMRNHLLHHARTRCSLMDRLRQLFIPSPPRSENDLDAFVDRSRQALDELGAIALEMLIDCLCYTSLPTCPPEVCDDRLLLACVTVQGDRILRICHADVRRYVPTPHTLFPALLSLVIEDLCCTDLRLRGIGVAETGVPTNVAVPPRGVFAPFNFAASPRTAAAAGIFGGFNAALESAFVPPAAAVDAASFIGQPAGRAREVLSADLGGIDEVVVKWTPAESMLHSLGSAAIRRGQPARMYVDENHTVLGFAPLSEADLLRSELSAANQRLEALEKQMQTVLKASRSKGAK